MKHFYLKTLVLLLLCMVNCNIMASDETVIKEYDIAVVNDDGITIYYKFINNETELEVSFKESHVGYTDDHYYIDYYGYQGVQSLNIPETVTHSNNIFRVTSIGRQAFYECKELESITIPESIVCIDSYAFSGCKALNSIIIPNSVDSIGWRVFDGCAGLKTIVVENGNNSYDSRNSCNAIIESKTNSLIVGCRNTIIPNDVMSIGDYAFEGCDNLISIAIPNSVKSIGKYAFAYCSQLKRIDMGSSVNSVGYDAFYGCDLIEEIHLNDIESWFNIDFVNEYNYAYDLVSYSWGANPMYVSKTNINLYNKEGKIVDLVIPMGVKNIKPYAFAHCSVESVVLPNGLIEIGEHAFANCINLGSVVIPNSVVTIKENAFADCLSLYSVTSLINIPFNLDETAFQYTGTQYDKDIIYMAAKLYVPIGRTAMYSNVQGWKKFMNIMETDTKFKLTYMLDGEVYKTYEIQATEVITPEPAPYKEGYIFSGWSDIPYLMPARDVTVTGSFTVDPESQVGVDIVKKENVVPETYYSPKGCRLDAPQRGINIIKMSNGSTKKVFVK